MSALAVPEDVAAERVVVGCAVATPHGARLAHERLDAADFYGYTLRRLFEVAAHLGEATDFDAVEERIPRAAVLAGVDVAEVAALVRERPVMHDVAGTYAGRVARAAVARLAMRQLAEAYNQLAAGAPVEDVVGHLVATAPLLHRAAVGTAA